MFNRTRAAYNGRAGLIGSAVIVALIAAVGLAVVLWPKGDSDANSPHKPPTSTGSVTAPSTPAETDPALTGFVTLPAPTGDVDGLPALYPHTALGAVSTVLAFQQQVMTLDYTAAEHAVSVYSPEWTDGAKEADQGVAQLRSAIDIPATGSAPIGASIASTVDGVKWRVIGSDAVAVSSERTITFTAADGSVSISKAGAGWTTFKWSNGRWIDDVSADDGANPAYAKPGSATYVAAGWQVIKNDDWLGGTP